MVKTTFLKILGARLWVPSALIAVVLTLSGCAAPAPIVPERMSNLKRVGVLTLLPSELNFRKIGTTVFDNESVLSPVGSSFNDTAFQTVSIGLKSPGRLIVKLNDNQNLLEKRVRSNVITFDSPAENISTELSKMVAEHSLDTVVIVAQNFDSDRGIRGIEFTMRTAFGANQPPMARAGLTTIVVDSKIKAVAQRYEPAILIVQKPNKTPWTYSLNDDLDVLTKKHIVEIVNEAVAMALKAHLASMGFSGTQQ